MILFSRETGTMFSDVYGYEGSKELRAFAKKMRLDRSSLKDEGHPVDEHYLVPFAKHPGMQARGANIISLDEHRTRKNAKREQVQKAISTSSARPMTQAYVPDEAYHPPSFDNRRRDRSKNWRQEEAA
jgi:hypothetical protein